MLDYSHNPWLLAASLCVSLMAGFTGLSLTHGLSERTIPQRKLAVALGAIALGGGIWSMHFVAMLGLRLPILFYYDAVVTLISALVAILITGLALLMLHFRKRTPACLLGAGILVGLGILAMHYIGMAGLQLCQALYTPGGIALSVVSSCTLSCLAFWVAYGRRTHTNILLGTVCFGGAVFLVHFVAIFGTSFVATDSTGEVGPLIGNEIMAIGVVLTSFALCGAFLLTSVTFLNQPSTPVPMPDEQPEKAPAAPVPEPVQPFSQQIPYEMDGQTRFLPLSDVAAIQAEGHYSYLFTRKDKVFCSWSITEAEKRLDPNLFVKTHRSYLVNPRYVTGFERMKDNGSCLLNLPAIERVPVSRSRLKQVRDLLGV